MKTEVFDIQGLNCSACVAHVDKAMKSLEGIQAVQVNLLTNSMSVKYDEGNLSVSEIEAAVEKAGYKASSRQKVVDIQGGTAEAKTVKSKMKIDTELLRMKRRWQLSLILLIPLLYIAMGPMLRLPLPGFLNAENHALTFVFVQFLLAVPIYIINHKYFSVGFKSLAQGVPNMDTLIALGSSAAMLYGIFGIFRIAYGLEILNLELVKEYSHNVYFESGATILTLITVGKYLETKSKSRTSEALTKLINLAPQTAFVLRNGKEIEIPINELKVGDTVIVKSGQSIPVDGVILSGNASIDESALTGESMPVYKQEGDALISASICQTGYLTFRATKVGEDTTLSQIIRLVEEASSSKAPISRLADKISAVFVPVVITISIIATVTWILLGYPFEFALSIGIAVLVISCPCALGLATPVAIMVGTGKAASQGMLIKSAESLEMGHKIDTVVLDKTGTITEGKPSVTKIVTSPFFPENKLLEIAASLEKQSEHPLAKAVLDEAEFRYITVQEVENFVVFPGMGIKANYNDRLYFAGNSRLMQEQNISMKNFDNQASKLSDEGNTILYIANEKDVIGLIAVADTIKANSYASIEKLHKMGLEVVMLTGDQMRVAEQIQKQLGINQVIAEVLPQGKEEEIRKLQAQGKVVAMVGDGINDAPALTRADLGIAIGAGSDIAIESADIVLMSNNLQGVSSFIQLSKRVMRNIKQNLFWAFFYNILGIPLAAGVFYTLLGWKLSPMFAAAAMSLSSVTVVLNALRIKANRKTVSKS